MMATERGTAWMMGGQSKIIADDGPSPVVFDRAKFDQIVHDAPVVFKRHSLDPFVAVCVALASEVDTFVALARRSSELAPQAEEVLTSHALKLLAQAQIAPTSQTYALMRASTLHFAELADRLSQVNGPVGAAAVRSLL